MKVENQLWSYDVDFLYVIYGPDLFLFPVSVFFLYQDLTYFEKYARLQSIMIRLLWLQQETTLREDVSDSSKRRDLMGDKGGKKDKDKGQKQKAEKQKQKSKNKLDKQPKRKP